MKLSIRTYIILFVLFPLVLLGVLTGQRILKNLEESLERKMQEEVELVAKAVKPFISNALNSSDASALELAMSSVSDINRIYSLYVYNQAGTLIASLGPDLPQRKRAEVQVLLEAGQEVGEYDQLVRREVYSYFMPLESDRLGNSGLLHVTRKRSDIAKDLFNLRSRFFLTLLLIGGVIFLVFQMTYHFGVLSPLEKIRETIDKIRDGDQTQRIKGSSVKEFSLIGQDINQMLDDLDSSRNLLIEGQKEQLELLEKLQQSNKMAALGQFAAGVAHELGAPLSVSTAMIQRRRRRASEDDKPFLDELEEEQLRMQEIIQKILNFSHPEVVVMQELDVRNFFEDLERRASNHIENKNVELIIHKDVEPHVKTNSVVLEQILFNLLKNAIDATQEAEKRFVELSVEDREEVRIHVEDSGEGVTEEIKEKIFEPFFSTKSVGAGTGLGLSIVHTLAKEINCYIEVDNSIKWGGAKFSLIFTKEKENEK